MCHAGVTRAPALSARSERPRDKGQANKRGLPTKSHAREWMSRAKIAALRRSDMLSGIRTRLSGKWQIPLLLVAFALMTYSVITIPAKPVPPPPSPAEAISSVQQLVDGGLHRRAIREASAVLDRPELSDEQRAFVHLQLARSRFAEATRLDKLTVDSGLAAKVTEARDSGLTVIGTADAKIADFIQAYDITLINPVVLCGLFLGGK